MMRPDLLAPCGINCGVCMRYLATVSGIADKNKSAKCTGCRHRNKTCAFIKGSCEWLKEKRVDFCFQCPVFPCEKLERLNRRYTNRYNADLIGNLLQIKELGVNAWLAKEAGKWKCPKCGGTVSLHDGKCYSCLARSESVKQERV